jgi:hypothetical protein
MCVREKRERGETRRRQSQNPRVIYLEVPLGRSVRHDGGHGVDIGSHAIALLHTEIALEIPNLDASVTGTAATTLVGWDARPESSFA